MKSRIIKKEYNGKKFIFKIQTNKTFDGKDVKFTITVIKNDFITGYDRYFFFSHGLYLNECKVLEEDSVYISKKLYSKFLKMIYNNTIMHKEQRGSIEHYISLR